MRRALELAPAGDAGRARPLTLLAYGEELSGHLSEAVRLGEEAWARGLRPELKSEWGVFRKAFDRVTGREFPPGPE